MIVVLKEKKGRKTLQYAKYVSSMSLSFKNNYTFITYVFEYFFLYLTYYMPVLHSYKKSESIWCSMKKRTFLRISYGPRPASLLKKRLWHRCFPVIFAKFLRTTFLQCSHCVNVSKERIFLVRIFLYSVRIQENADHKNLSI